MTSEGERHCEARRPIESLLRPKDLVNIGNWNVRTMYSSNLDTYGQKESWPPQNHLAPYCGKREDNGGLEVSGICESPGEGLGQVEEE